MAVTLTPNPSRLTLVRQAGMTNEGKPIFKSKTINNVHAGATNDDLYEIADALSQLFEHPVVLIERHDNGNLADI